jgi:hypothetical protein
VAAWQSYLVRNPRDRRYIPPEGNFHTRPNSLEKSNGDFGLGAPEQKKEDFISFLVVVL